MGRPAYAIAVLQILVWQSSDARVCNRRRHHGWPLFSSDVSAHDHCSRLAGPLGREDHFYWFQPQQKSLTTSPLCIQKTTSQRPCESSRSTILAPVRNAFRTKRAPSSRFGVSARTRFRTLETCSNRSILDAATPRCRAKGDNPQPAPHAVPCWKGVSSDAKVDGINASSNCRADRKARPELAAAAARQSAKFR